MKDCDCPNCVTPWKCNGPHLEKLSDFHYRCDYGYFIVDKEPKEKRWSFIPFEKPFVEELLEEILDILNYLKKKSSQK